MSGAAIAVRVDVVLLSLSRAPDRGPLVLLAADAGEPFPGLPALPGNAPGSREGLDATAKRVLESAGVRRPRHLEQLATFGDPDRDPRGRAISVSYLALLPEPGRPPDGHAWVATDDVEPPLAFDHARILVAGLSRVRSKLSYSTIASGLLPDAFTFSELQEVYEAVLGAHLDKRNFRRKVRSLGLLVEVEGQRRGSHRPAQLYRFAAPELVLLDDVIATGAT